MILDPANAFYQNHICCPKGISLKPRLNQTWPFSLASALISFSFNVKLQPLLDLYYVESSGSGGTFGLRLFLHFPVKTVHTSPTMSDDAFPAEWLENSNIPSPEKDTHTLSLPGQEMGSTRVWQQNPSSACLVHSRIQSWLCCAIWSSFTILLKAHGNEWWC